MAIQSCFKSADELGQRDSECSEPHAQLNNIDTTRTQFAFTYQRLVNAQRRCERVLSHARHVARGTKLFEEVPIFGCVGERLHKPTSGLKVPTCLRLCEDRLVGAGAVRRSTFRREGASESALNRSASESHHCEEHDTRRDTRLSQNSRQVSQ